MNTRFRRLIRQPWAPKVYKDFPGFDNEGHRAAEVVRHCCVDHPGKAGMIWQTLYAAALYKVPISLN
jgi:hypothetical protein